MTTIFRHRTPAAPGKRSFPDAAAAIALGIGMIAAAAPAACAQPMYDLSIAVRLGDTIGGKKLTAFQSALSLNNQGTLAFKAGYSGGIGVFTQNDLIATPGMVIGGLTLASLSAGQNPAIADNGTIIFAGTYNTANATGESGLFSQNSPLVLTNQIMPDGRAVTSVSPTAYGINPNGDFVVGGVYANVQSAGGGQGIFTKDGLLVNLDQPVGGTSVEESSKWLTYSKNGTVGFQGTFTSPNDGLKHTGLFNQTGLQIGENQDFLNNQNSLIANLYIGDRTTMGAGGQFAARALVDLGATSTGAIVTQGAIVVQNGDILGGRQVSNIIHSKFLSYGAVMNSAGTVAFLADSLLPGGADNHTGILTQNGLVAQVSSAVEGTTISGLLLDSNPVINDQGEIAFYANFSDGTSGIVTATPHLVGAAAPEPGPLPLLLLGGFPLVQALIARRQWRRKA